MRNCPSTGVFISFFRRKFSAVQSIQKGHFLILFFFFLFGFGGGEVWGQEPKDIPPSYEHYNKVDLSTINIELSGPLWDLEVTANTEDIIIAVSTDSEGNVYTLSFGSGVDKRDANGKIIKENFISADALDSPMDFAIDGKGFIYVADYLDEGNYTQHGKIKIFDSQGNLDRIITTGFYRPLGIEINSENIYITEYYDGLQGPEQGSVYSRISVYDKQTDTPIYQNESDVEIPYRIAVNSQGTIYVSQTRFNEDDPDQVLIFSPSLNLQGTLPDIQSPGSIVIDKFGFIHVIEYSGRIDFGQFLNYESLGFSEAIEIRNSIQEGIEENDVFVIKIYNSDHTLVGTFTDNEANEFNIEFPVDLTFGQCDEMYLDNADVDGLSLDFDLEIYERTPSFDVEVPSVNCIAPGKEFLLVDGTATITVDEIDDGSEDNCAIEYRTLSENTFTTPGEKQITLTVTDAAGNTNLCTTTIMIVGEEDPEPTFECKEGFTLQLDSNGQASLSPEDLYTGDAEGVIFDLSQENFTCSDMGTNPVTLSYSGAATGSCTMEIKVEDSIPPKVECPTPNYVISYEGEKKGKIPDFSEILTSSDNCTENLKFVQDPLPGTIITQDTWVKFYAEDEAGAQGGCAFWVVLKDDRQLTISCPGNKIYNPGSDCGTTMPNFLNEISVNIPEATVSQFPQAGFPVHGTIDVKFTAVYEDQKVSCSFKYISEDITPPSLDCVEDQKETIDPNEGFQLPNYILELDASDNCYIAKFQQIPEVGTIIYEDTEVTLIATDGSDNISECSFLIDIEEEESPLQISCPPDQEAFLNSICSFEIPDFTSLAETNNPDAKITQQPENGEIVHEDTEITLFATFEGETVECSFQLKLIDKIPPTITCPENQTRNFDPEAGFLIPDFTGLVSVEDNCGVEDIVQTPAEGTLIFEDEEIKITVSDNSGNGTSCSFQLILTEEEVLEISCPPTQLVEPTEENCGFIVPDYRNMAEINNEAAVITQNPEPGTVISGSAQIVLTATLEDETASCSFHVDVEDSTKPIAKCVGTYTIYLSPGEIKTINAEDLDAGSTDACGILNFELSKSSFSEADAGENIIQFIVTDQAGNKAECEVKVNVVVEDNDDQLECVDTLVLELDENGSTYLTAEDLYAGNDPNVSFTDDRLYFHCMDIGSHEVGLYDGNDTTNTCSTTVIVVDKLKPVANCASSLTVQLNANGVADVSPQNMDNGSSDNCGIAFRTLSRSHFTTEDIGSNPVVFTVFDSSGNSSSCQAEVIVQEYVPQEPEEFSCISPVTVYLDGNGIGTVETSALYEGEIPEGAEVSLDKNTFSCEDMPGTTINFSYKIGSETVECGIRINVEDTIKPKVKTSNIVLALNEEGKATISPENVDNGSSDNCQISKRVLSKTNFSCAEIGENSVLFSVTDSSGNIASAEVTVTITDPEANCSIGPVEPPEGGSFVIVYPNPGKGFINIKSSVDIELQKAMVFDMRGRFLSSKTFEDPASHNYYIDLRQVQSGVYTLMLYSETEEFIRRVIISTY